ncbi:hypothetical protein RZS08_10615, partial [Arthrospira platensis SPKY1]|nr:hypothetical protein [Arthrospira platensis SPKY1]
KAGGLACLPSPQGFVSEPGGLPPGGLRRSSSPCRSARRAAPTRRAGPPGRKRPGYKYEGRWPGLPPQPAGLRI